MTYTSAVRQRPIEISSDVKRDDVTVFVIVVGDVDSSRNARYFEVRLADGSHAIRAEWEPARSKAERDNGFPFRLIVDGGLPVDLILRDGDLFEPGYDEPATTRSGSFLEDVSLRSVAQSFWIFDDSDVERARLIAPRFTTTVESDSVTDWVGCEADFAGAGAGVGAVVGAIAGAAKGLPLKGAGAGAVIGGVAGAAFGLGYCTAQAVCG